MNALEQYRKSKGWNQTRMGKELGVTAGAVCNYERGRRSPQPAKREFIAKVTRGSVPVDSWDDVPEPPKETP